MNDGMRIGNGKEMATMGGTRARGRAGILVALFIAGFTAFLNLYATQPLLPQFRHFFHASELLVSLTISGPVLAVALTASVIGLAADTLGRKRVIIAAMLGLSIPTALAGIAHSLGQLVVWRFLQGFFTAGIAAVTVAYISEESPVSSVGSIMATYVTGGVIGGFAGRFIAGLTAAHYGWRVSFFILGAITCAGALTSWWLLPRSTKFVRQRNVGAALGSMRTHFWNPHLLATYAVGFNVLFCLVGAFTYVNFYLADRPFFLGPRRPGLNFCGLSHRRGHHAPPRATSWTASAFGRPSWEPWPCPLSAWGSPSSGRCR